MNSNFGEKFKAETKFAKENEGDVKFVNKSLSQRGNKFGSAHQRSPLENNLHKQKETNTDEDHMKTNILTNMRWNL